MFKIASIQLALIPFLFAFSANAESHLSGSYKLIQNDCMNDIPTGTLVQIDANESMVTVSTSRYVSKYPVGNFEGGPSGLIDYWVRSGTYSDDGNNFSYDEKDDSSAGTETDFTRIRMSKTEQGVQIEDRSNFRRITYCRLMPST